MLKITRFVKIKLFCDSKCYVVSDNTLLSPQTHAATKNFSRWSTSRLNGSNSNSTSPCSSTRSSFNYRQPYLGWRSQEKLSKPRTPAERLAAGLLAQQQHEQQVFLTKI